MAVLTPITSEEARELLAAYELGDLRSVTGIPAGSVNSNYVVEAGGSRIFLRIYEEQGAAGAAREAAMLERLARAGVPTPAPHRRRDGGLVSVVRGKPAALFPWREGSMRCQAGVTPLDTARVGEALAKVHAAGVSEPCGAGRFGFEGLQNRLQAIAASGSETFLPLVPVLREALERTHAARTPGLPGGLTHGDLFRDNVLWDAEGNIAALLDFESACADTFAYDLMVCVLSWCFGSDFEAGLARAMCEGYQRVRVLTPAERDGLLVEGEFAALRFTLTRITDYALRTGVAGPRVVKHWQRFYLRLEKLRSLGPAGLRRILAV
jgi:homoserine kinase type II